MKKVVWKTIGEFPDYEVSNTSLVREKKTKKLNTIYMSNRNGHMYVTGLFKDGENHTRYLARIVVLAFDYADSNEEGL